MNIPTPSAKVAAPAAKPAYSRQVTSGNEPHNYDSGGAVNASGGSMGGDADSTRQNTVALGGANTTLIGTHMSGIQEHTAAISKAMTSKSPKALGKVGEHLDAIRSHVSAAKAHVSKVQSESDAGDMSGYDPTGGTGNQI